MYFSNISMNFHLLSPGIRNIGKMILCHNRNLSPNYYSCCNTNASLNTLKNQALLQQRCYSINPDEMPDEERRLHPLTDDEPIVVPSFFQTLRSIYYLHAQIKRFDPEFDLQEFVTASRQAVAVVSHYLSKENYAALEGLVTDNVIQKLRNGISRLSEAQKELIEVKVEDIFTTFPYSMEVIHKKDGGDKKALVEIAIACYSMQRLAEVRPRDAPTSPEYHMQLITDYHSKIHIANYRFAKDYAQGVQAPWIVNMCNHFMLATLGVNPKHRK